MEYKNIVGDLQAQRYIISESKRVYASQGQDLNDKHIEVVVKQLFSKVFIEDGGESSFIPGTYVKYEEFIKVNAQLEAQGKRPAQGKRVALGLTTVALTEMKELKEVNKKISLNCSFLTLKPQVSTHEKIILSSLVGFLESMISIRKNLEKLQ